MPATASKHPVLEILAALTGEELQLAPHVAFGLHHSLQGDWAAILETAGTLSTEQRSGQALLPDPMPLSPATQAAVRDRIAELSERERAMLLRAAVCVFRRTQPLLVSCNASMSEAAASRAAVHLRFVAGGFEFEDPRIRAAVHAGATLGERNAAHADLALAFAAAGEIDMAHWHRTLSTVEGDQDLASGLLRVARRALSRGQAAWAHSVTKEAVCHAPAELVDEARLLAAETALHAGCLAEADRWASSVQSTAHPDLHRRAQHCAEQIATLLAGRLPAALLRPDGSAGELPEPADDGLGAEYRRVAEAFRLAEQDEFEAALRTLSDPVEPNAAPGIPARPGSPTPLRLATRRVARSLVYYWSGKLCSAEAELQEAALRLPVESVLGGISGPLAQRLGIDIYGEPGPMAAALKTRKSQPADSTGSLLDRATLAYLAGQRAEAETLLAVAAERGNTAVQSIYLPQPDGADRWGLLGNSARQRESSRLRARIGSSQQAGLAELATAAVVLGQAPTSPFERGRTEFELGRAFARYRNRDAARHYLLAAASSFEEAGAGFWRQTAESELSGAAEGLPQPVLTALPPQCPEWTGPLTERESEVALLVADGSANREVALALHLSVRTVEVHLSRVFAKLGVRSRVELSILAHRSDAGLGRSVG